MVSEVHTEDCNDKDKEFEDSDYEDTDAVRPELNRQEVPVLHLVELLALLISELDARFVMSERICRDSRSHIKLSQMLVLRGLLQSILLHTFKVTHGRSFRVFCRLVLFLFINLTYLR